MLDSLVLKNAVECTSDCSIVRSIARSLGRSMIWCHIYIYICIHIYRYTHASFCVCVRWMSRLTFVHSLKMTQGSDDMVLLFFHVTFVSLNTRTCVCVCKGYPLLIRNVCASVPWLTFVLTLDIQPGMPFCWSLKICKRVFTLGTLVLSRWQQYSSLCRRRFSMCVCVVGKGITFLFLLQSLEVKTLPCASAVRDLLWGQSDRPFLCWWKAGSANVAEFGVRLRSWKVGTKVRRAWV